MSKQLWVNEENAMKVEKIYDYDPSQSEYELAKNNKVFLVIHGAGYSDTPPEEDWVESFNGYSIMDEVANDYVIRNFNTQRLVYFKEIELAEEWNLDEDFMDELWRAKKGKWNTYSDPGGTVFFKCYKEN